MKLAAIGVTASLLGMALPAAPAMAAMGACEGAYVKQNLADQIRLYTICLDGLWDNARAGAVHNRGVAYLQSGQIQQAISDFDMSLYYDPRYGLAYFNRAAANAQLGNYRLAIADLDHTLELLPSRVHVDARFQRGVLRQAERDYAGALEDFDAVIARNIAWLDPERRYKSAQITWGMLAKASLLATAEDPAFRNGAQAIALAEAVQAREDSAIVRSVLASAYAEAGRFVDAAREQALAVQMAEQEGWGEESAGLDAQLAAYRDGQSYRTAATDCVHGGLAAYCDGSAWRVEQMHLRRTHLGTGFLTSAEISAADIRALGRRAGPLESRYSGNER